MRHDGQKTETSDNALPDLLSALLSQWDEEPCEEAPIADPPAIETSLHQTLVWQIPDSVVPTVEEPIAIEALADEPIAELVEQASVETQPIEEEIVLERIPDAAPACVESIESADLASMVYAVNESHSPGVGRLRYIQFWMAADAFAVPIAQVIESGRLPDVAPLPCVHEAIRGLINLHGEIVPLLDLRSMLGNNYGDGPPDEKMLIVRTGNSEGACGLAVDRVAGMLALEPNDIQNLTPSDTTAEGGFVNGLCERQGNRIRLLDLERLFDSLSGNVASAATPIQDQPGRN